MAKVTKNIDPATVDLLSTALVSPGLHISETDSVEYYHNSGELAATVSVSKIIDFIEANALAVPEDKEPYEVDSKDMLEYLDSNFDQVTELYFNAVLAAQSGKEVRHAA